MKQNLIMAALCLLCALFLFGCGAAAAPEPSAVPTPEASPSAMPTASLPDEDLEPDVEETKPVNEALEAAKKYIAVETIGYDKLNQLRHLKYLKDAAGVKNQMARHKALLEGKFRVLEETLERDLGGLGIAEWTHPNGGYFVSLDLSDGCAKRTYELAKEAGVTLTPAGATFPYGKDPRDRNLRLAPTCCPVGDLATAASILTVAARLAALEKLLSR